MSLLQQIITADSQSRGWSSTYTKHIHEVSFHSRAEAEKAFEDMLPFYKKIVGEGTWDDVKERGGDTTHADQLSFNHHMWVDENKKGFSFCVYFDNIVQRDQIRKDFRKFFKDNQVEHHIAHLNEQEETRIRRLKSATHSVELDITNKVVDFQIITDFMNVAMTLPENGKALYIDTIGKDGNTRLKAYFANEVSAKEFARIADLKVKAPLDRLESELAKAPLVREFHPAKVGLIPA